MFPGGLGVEGIQVDDNLRLLLVLVLLPAVLSTDLAWFDHRLGFNPGVQGTDSLQDRFLIRVGNLWVSC